MPLRAAGAVLALVGAALTSAEAQIYRWGAETGPPRWHITGGIGLIRRETGAWQPIHLALDSAGWDHVYPPCTGGFACLPADQLVESRPVIPALAVRRLITGHLQARAFFSTGSPGKYPGLNGTTQIYVRPSTTTLGVQAAGTLGPFWGALGPTFTHGTVHITGNTLDSARSSNGAGVALGLGFTVPKYSRVYFEGTFERHWAGTIATPVIPMPGAPDIPAMNVPLSHTLLWVGVGIRR